jgi:hypothetical protein
MLCSTASGQRLAVTVVGIAGIAGIEPSDEGAHLRSLTLFRGTLCVE